MKTIPTLTGKDAERFEKKANRSMRLKILKEKSYWMEKLFASDINGWGYDVMAQEITKAIKEVEALLNNSD
jgi:hypothetical protein